MITKDVLKEVVERQAGHPIENYVERDVRIPDTKDSVVIMTGIRRCGKSTLMKDSYYGSERSVYLSFESPLLSRFEVNDFFKLEELYPEHRFYFDEIQNVDGWERYVRDAYDRGLKIYLTGSNASLLSRELGTRLTGRYFDIELFPFSYPEYLRFYGKESSSESLMSYMEEGGFPVYLKYKEDGYHSRLFHDIISRDVIVRKGIRNESVMISLANYVISNVSKILSFNSISKKLGIKSVRTTIDYMNLLQDAYLIFLVPQYSFSITNQIVNPKKVYAIDPGIINANTLSFSKDIGRILENLVYLDLRKRYREIFYYRKDYECDFVVKEKDVVSKVIQVCYHVDDSNLDRELMGIKEAQKDTRADKALIITYDQEDEIDGVRLVPAWKWLTG